MTRAWWISFAVATLLRAVAAARLPLQGTEAYYWLWSQHLAAGYYDHPPLVAWSIALSTALLGQKELSVRLPALAGVSLATLAVWWLARRLAGEEAGARAGLAALAFPYLSYLSVTVFPDGLLLGFSGLSLALAWAGRWAASGFCMGLALLAKFPAVTLAAATLAWKRALRPLLPWALWALLALSPFLAWNASHDWATFAYQLGTRTAREGRLRPLGVVEFLAGQAAAAHPVLFVVLVGAVAWAWRRGGREGSFLALHAALPFAFFLLLALGQRVQPHWPLVAYLTALPALGWACLESPRFRLGWSLGVGLSGSLVALALAVFALAPGLFFLPPYEWRASLTEPWGFAGLGRRLASEAGDRFLLAENHGTAGALTFYSGQTVHWYSKNLHGREFLRWEDYSALRGRDALFVDTRPLEERPDVRQMLAGAFQEVGPTETVVIHWQGRPARTFYLTSCRGFTGQPPPEG
ncbi:MAG TPA: glycosyltransferase family 39 protein [Candidatus Nitrosotenuis sp.]|nr:glycosyltransferase family 39 protein [Candidatus Nitrosotenuis sp.]